MTETIKLFIIDKDLRIRESGDYEIGDSDKVRIKSGGTENWNPKVTETSFVEKKSWKKYLLFGERGWKREYYVMRKGSKCIDFLTGDVPTPDSEQLKKANLSLLAKEIGSEREKGTPWYIWLTMFFQILVFLLLLSIGGYLRL